jgi:hypothetical protein
LFGQVRQVITTDSLREQFCSLPFPLVLRWAGLDQLAVDSENSVAVLLTAWYRAQCSSGTAPTDAQCEQLSGCLRLGQLGPSYLLQVLQQLPWWRQPEGVQPHHLVVLGMAKLAGSSSGVSAPQFEPPAFKQGERAADAGPGKLEWQTCVVQLTAAFDSGNWVNHLPPVYWAGWEWTYHLKWSPAADGANGKTLGMFSTVAAPALLGLAQEGVGVTAEVEATLASQSCLMQGDATYCTEIHRGRRDMQLVPAVPTAAAVAAALAEHLQGTQLPVGLSVSYVQ